MSLDYYAFEKESGITGFLAGIVSTAADEFSMKLYDLGVRYESFEADIFYIGRDNEITFEDSIKKRMRESWYGTDKDETYINNLINSSKFKLVKEDKTTLSNIIVNMYDNDLTGIRNIAKQFEQDVEYHIKRPRGIYSIPFQHNREIYECGSIISMCYTYTIFDMKLIEYDEYALLLIRGSNE